MWNIIGRKFLFLGLSELLILVSIVVLALFGLNPGVEFSSGSLLTLHFEGPVSVEEVKTVLSQMGYPGAIVQLTGTDDFLIRSTVLSTEAKEGIKSGLAEALGGLSEVSFENIDPVIAGETVNTSAIAVGVAAVGIALYITWAFRRMPKPFRYGACAIIALVHDIVIVLGMFAVLGVLLGWEVDLMFVTGILAVVGYSINDTVVVFDRIREVELSKPKASFASVVNSALNATLARSFSTSITTLVAVVALLLFVGANIQTFAVTLIVGIIAGTYSSIIASALLVVWEKGEWRRLVPFLKG